MIRKQRRLLGISQEQLSEGICSVATLSRVENGERLPNKANFDALMQRMGHSGEMYDAYVSEQDFQIHEKKFAIRQAIMQFDLSLAKELLEELDLLIQEDDKFDYQFVSYCKMIVFKSKSNLNETLEGLKTAIKITQPRYGNIKLYELFLSFDEITILNNIANIYPELGDYDKGISLLYEIRDYMNLKYINSEERMRLYPMILYNLSKWLGLRGRYKEAIEICDIGIESCQNSGRAKLLCRILYNKAWSMSKLKTYKEQEYIKVLMQSYYVALALGEYEAAEKYKMFAINNTIISKDLFIV